MNCISLYIVLYLPHDVILFVGSNKTPTSLGFPISQMSVILCIADRIASQLIAEL